MAEPFPNHILENLHASTSRPSAGPGRKPGGPSCALALEAACDPIIKASNAKLSAPAFHDKMFY